MCRSPEVLNRHPRFDLGMLLYHTDGDDDGGQDAPMIMLCAVAHGLSGLRCHEEGHAQVIVHASAKYLQQPQLELERANLVGSAVQSKVWKKDGLFGA